SWRCLLSMSCKLASPTMHPLSSTSGSCSNSYCSITASTLLLSHNFLAVLGWQFITWLTGVSKARCLSMALRTSPSVSVPSNLSYSSTISAIRNAALSSTSIASTRVTFAVTSALRQGFIGHSVVAHQYSAEGYKTAFSEYLPTDRTLMFHLSLCWHRHYRMDLPHP